MVCIIELYQTKVRAYTSVRDCKPEIHFTTPATDLGTIAIFDGCIPGSSSKLTDSRIVCNIACTPYASMSIETRQRRISPELTNLPPPTTRIVVVVGFKGNFSSCCVRRVHNNNILLNVNNVLLVSLEFLDRLCSKTRTPTYSDSRTENGSESS